MHVPHLIIEESAVSPEIQRNDVERCWTADKRILVVDDEPFNLKSIKYLIELSASRHGIPEEAIQQFIDYARDGDEYVQKVEQLFLHE